MEATFNLKIDSLSEEFITKIRALFSKNAIVEFKVTDNIQSETDYLLSFPENKEMLRKSIEQLNESKLISKTFEELTK